MFMMIVRIPPAVCLPRLFAQDCIFRVREPGSVAYRRHTLNGKAHFVFTFSKDNFEKKN